MIDRRILDREAEQLLVSKPIPSLRPDRLKRIETAVVRDLRPVRPLSPEGAYFAAIAGIFLAVFSLGCYLAGQQGWFALSDLQKIVVFAPMAASVALLAFSVVRQMRPARKLARSSALISAALFVVLLLAILGVFRPAQESSFVQHGMACFRTGMAFAIPAAFLFALPLHRGAGLSPALSGAASGGLAGLAGLAVLEIHCPNLNVYHIVVWHVSVTVVCVVAGLVFSSVTFRRWNANH
jgi:hypothetical protein